jgi:nucleotide sugar dehydrogenase
MQTISVIGVGRLGLCLCLTLERGGYRVVGCDIREDHVRSINDKTLRSLEPNVNEYLSESAHFVATTELKAAIDHSDTIIVTVRTTSENDGRYNVSQVDSVIDQIVELGRAETPKSLIINCNVNPEYSDFVQTRLSDLNYLVSYNPEWVKQGSILQDQSSPDTVVIGAPTDEECAKIEAIYSKICTNEPTIHRMSRLSAEITKISLNCVLTNKIALANMVGDIAISRNQDPNVILAAIGSDSRIGNKFFGYGFGYGGPCFPRDTRAFTHYANKCGVDSSIISGVVESNRKHLEFQVESYLEKNPRPAVVVIEDITYKKGTNIIEESQQLLFAVELANRGYNVILKESEDVIEQVKAIYGDLFEYEPE